MKKCKVLKGYKTKYTNPIKVKMGDLVLLGKEEAEEKWKGWIWAETLDQKGWIPMQNVSIALNKKQGIILEDYSAQELTVIRSSFVYKIHSLNGWSWCKYAASGEEGWLPNEILREIEVKKEE
jgi:hypothetical protein